MGPNLEKPAIDAMAEALLKTPANTAWLVVTGTQTNIAQLISKYPAVVDHIKGLSMMGGAIVSCRRFLLVSIQSKHEAGLSARSTSFLDFRRVYLHLVSDVFQG